MFQDENKEAGARSGAKGHETEKHEVEEEILSCVGAKQIWGWGGEKTAKNFLVV